MERKRLSIVLLAILFFVLGVQVASSGWFSSQLRAPGDLSVAGFLPLLTRNYSASAAASSTLVVFSSAGTTAGGGGGRSGMNQICANHDPASHFCSLNEIESAMMGGGVRFAPGFVDSWVDRLYLGTQVTHQVDGSLHVSSWNYNNCNGWTSNSNSIEAVYILVDGMGINIEPDPATGQSFAGFCNTSRHVACCRWEP